MDSKDIEIFFKEIAKRSRGGRQEISDSTAVATQMLKRVCDPTAVGKGSCDSTARRGHPPGPE